ncbi:hypothetical protein D2V07_03805 [Aurantiacibacter zhengii]|uniref:Uncharacterized protein n=2 Tax=Aurantiacibacter zhengii TaxID=2307003 RepID=A0A418NUA5_9SPHN|nr:hypothetical protein D2V07_03805 [Aurantiacibacter zhengii]
MLLARDADRHALLQEIATLMQRYPALTYTRIGVEAANDTRLVFDLKNGRTPNARVTRNLCDWIRGMKTMRVTVKPPYSAAQLRALLLLDLALPVLDDYLVTRLQVSRDTLRGLLDMGLAESETINPAVPSPLRVVRLTDQGHRAKQAYLRWLRADPARIERLPCLVRAVVKRNP